MTSITIIDDDQLTREQVIATLEFRGYTTTSAINGRAGIDLVKDVLPDLVLCDINMPEMDGYQVLDALRYDPRTADIPFVFLTARDERDDMRRGMSLGADDYLPKPFTSEELLESVKTQLKKRHTIAQKYESTISLLRENIIYALPHELRTPLAGSIGFAEVLRMDADKLNPDEVRSIAGRIVKHNQRLHRVLENFLIYAQIEVLASDRNRLAQMRNYITPHAGDVLVTSAEAKADGYGRLNDLDTEIEDIALRIADDNLGKIVEELVDNAFKFSQAGSLVTLRAARDGDVYIIGVYDHGRGMTPEQIASIGAYMQFDRVLYEQQGLGLGLTIARRLVDLHGGQLAVHSTPGSGTEVRVSLPLYA